MISEKCIFALGAIKDNNDLEGKVAFIELSNDFIHVHQGEIVTLQNKKLIIFREQTGLKIQPVLTDLGKAYLEA